MTLEATQLVPAFDDVGSISTIDSQQEREFISQILKSRSENTSSLPDKLGLNEHEYADFVDHYQQLGLSFDDVIFDEVNLEKATFDKVRIDKNRASKIEVRQELFELREEEWYELVTLMLSYSKNNSIQEVWMAKILAAACLGDNHLWRDVGMASRSMLRDLIEYYFPTLAIKNTQNMRWKKFFYKQLCETEGHYVCRAPSCDICPTYNDCFGVEE